MRRILLSFVIALVLPLLVLAALAAAGLTPGGWETLIAFALGVAASVAYWRGSASSPRNS